eukprot:CAMPEP_0118649534 /NCGR_PEP_ID=MMETSP0785-20121206/9756_1 /TAXON_ID=91992 /ORGANISM="Bolidomonas pacifica, Strain CCMP 1866" /LENGTH=194 /DNA_ID=CAMNT_0006541831 /DNA_START=124 /DNA_END=704 /DNA_ORIENTATION=-
MAPKQAPKQGRTRRVVLDEDTYVEALDKVIRRDYFPSTIIGSTVDKDNDHNNEHNNEHNQDRQDDSFFDDTVDGFNVGYDDDYDDNDDNNNDDNNNRTKRDLALSSKNLTDFHRVATSEDNEYFHKQHQEDLSDHRERYAYAYTEGKPLMLMPDGTKQTEERLALMEATPLASDEFDLKPKGMVETWKYRASNA